MPSGEAGADSKTPYVVGGVLSLVVFIVIALLALSFFTYERETALEQCGPSPDLPAAPAGAANLVELQANP